MVVWDFLTLLVHHRTVSHLARHLGGLLLHHATAHAHTHTHAHAHTHAASHHHLLLHHLLLHHLLLHHRRLRLLSHRHHLGLLLLHHHGHLGLHVVHLGVELLRSDCHLGRWSGLSVRDSWLLVVGRAKSDLLLCNNAVSHLKRGYLFDLLRLWRLLQLFARSGPSALHVDVTSRLPFVLDLPPVIHVALSADERRQLGNTASNRVVRHNVLIHNGKMDVVADVLNVNLNDLICPGWGLARIVLGLGAPTLHARFDDHVWVHLAHRLSVMGKACLKNADLQLASA